MQILLCSLVLAAGLSPLLTFERLLQLKEWRRDRLREHLRREGRFSQLFGIVRPSVTILGLIVYFSLIAFKSTAEFAWISLVTTYGALVWLMLFKFVLGKQSRPVWTMKAVSTFTLAILLYFVVALILAGFNDLAWVMVILSLLPLTSFCFVISAWIVLRPLDQFLKRRVLKKARAIRRKMPNLAVIGITGSVGKTTTKELLAHILSDRSLLVTPAHVNTEMGVANLIRRSLKESHQIFIVEMGAYRRGEIKLLCALTEPHIGIITYIGRQHLGLFGSQDDLCSAKGELFEALPPEGHAFLNADTTFCENLMKKASCPVHTVGTGGHATYEAFDIVEEPAGIAFTLRGAQFHVPILGTHQVTNILLAVAAAETLGVPVAESAKRLASFSAPTQTFERKEGRQGQVVLDDTYNASPESFRAVIEWSRTHAAKKKILITSGLLELGKEERLIHEELGLLSREIFHEAIFLNKKCVHNFEQGYGKPVRVFPRQKFALKIEKDMLIVCVGRMPETIVEKLLT
ncbi:MAG TPA: UDP-N-acetylmuramoyl-tripeptide--D-alanyl-D-alanine ligase [Candidatus Peribacterales bacterium]|nr:UDP-N-acetylmuramoyl-tripeptide--D-alanyl-D-alanine ligase [Candidatus Peribacterales bacterium]